MAKTKNQVAIGLRVPPELAEWLRKLAEENSRSLSNQTTVVLQQFRKQQEAATPGAAK